MHESKKKCIGIDVGGTTVKIGLFETDGTLLFKWEVPTRKEEGGRYILEDVAASIREVLTEKEIHFSDILGAGLGIPGPVMPDGYVEVCVNLGWPCWTIFRLRAEMMPTWQLLARCGVAAVWALPILSW